MGLTGGCKKLPKLTLHGALFLGRASRHPEEQIVLHRVFAATTRLRMPAFVQGLQHKILKLDDSPAPLALRIVELPA